MSKRQSLENLGILPKGPNSNKRNLLCEPIPTWDFDHLIYFQQPFSKRFKYFILISFQMWGFTASL